MALIVQKFGGTSVGSPERIKAVADRIAATRAAGHSLVVVVSAMGHTTDELIDLAFQVAKAPSHREMDMLLTAGERISTALLSMALAERNIPAISLTGSQTGIITDPSHRRARVQRILGERVRNGLADEKVVIVAGFQGVSEGKEITTLGRGGSDTTAVALAAALQADLCEIYTDVDGVFSADPRVVPDARLWARLPMSLMIELATRGAGVLHPRCVELARHFQLKLVVRNSLNQKAGTEVILDSGKGMEDFRIIGISADAGKFLITIEMSRETVLSAIFDRAAQSHLPVVAPVFGEGRLRFFSDKDGEGDWKKHLEELSALGFVKSYRIDPGQIPLSVVGERFAQDGAALQQVIEALAQNHISVTMGSSSALGMTLAISANHADEGVKVLHALFF